MRFLDAPAAGALFHAWFPSRLDALNQECVVPHAPDRQRFLCRREISHRPLVLTVPQPPSVHQAVRADRSSPKERELLSVLWYRRSAYYIEDLLANRPI